MANIHGLTSGLDGSKFCLINFQKILKKVLTKEKRYGIIQSLQKTVQNYWICTCVGIGIRYRLKICRPKGIGGSWPPTCTKLGWPLRFIKHRLICGSENGFWSFPENNEKSPAWVWDKPETFCMVYVRVEIKPPTTH